MEKEEPRAQVSNMIEKGMIAICDLLRSMCIQDRLAGIEIITMLRIHDLHYTEGKCDAKKVEEIQKLREGCDRSMVEFYPTNNVVVNITSFTGDHVMDLVNETRKGYQYRIWWVGDPMLFTSL